MTLYDVYEKILGKLLELFPEKKANRIYQYTSKEVLWEFLKPDNDFYCTYFRDLSDPMEFITGMGVVTQMWREYCRGEEDEFLTPLRYSVAMSGKYGKNLLPWIMSFSKAKDETSQWRTYTNRNEGGFSVGFDVDVIRQRLYENNNQSHGAWCLLSFLPCLYADCDSQESINTLLEFVLRDVVVDLKGLLDARQIADNNEQIARSLLYLLMSSIIKLSNFKEEQEWRLVVQPLELNEVAVQVEMIGGKPRIRTGLFGAKTNDKSLDIQDSVATTKKDGQGQQDSLQNDHMLSSAIGEIIVSPHGPSEFLHDKAELSLALRGVGDGERPMVVSSESPYRG